MIRSLSMVTLAALVAGCGSSNVPFATTPGPSAAKVPARSSLVYPFLYVGDLGTSDVYVESYPQGKHKLTITSPGSVNGLCADFNGGVNMTDAHDNQIIEYQYASTKQLRVLKDPGYYLGGCSVDPTSNDLAVAIQPTNSGPGGVAIFRNGKGKPHNYTSSETYFAGHCAYDDNGDVFVDGSNPNTGFFVAELPHKSHTFSPIALNQSIAAGGDLQWDGGSSLLAIDDQGVGYQGSTVYEFAIDGSSAALEGSTPLSGSADVIGFTLVETSTSSRIIGANTGSAPSVMYWHYPKGGKPTKTITGFSEPVSVVIASKPSGPRR